MTPSDYQQICPECGAVLGYAVSTCPKCNRRLSGTATDHRPSAAPRLPLSQIGSLLKIIAIIAVVVLIGYLGHRAITGIVSSAQKSPYPDSPTETIEQFFAAMQNLDDQRCYQLLSIARKATTIIEKQSRENYYYHFARIRNYLQRHSGPDFATYMEIGPDSKTIFFTNNIALTVTLKTQSGPDKKTHYAISQVNEFPIDIAPGIGTEKYRRSLNRAMESLDALNVDESALDDPAEIIRQRPDESPRQRLRRLCDACLQARQLDTRHTLLEWIIKEFPNDKATTNFMHKLDNDENEVYQLRLLAADFLEQRP